MKLRLELPRKLTKIEERLLRYMTEKAEEAGIIAAAEQMDTIRERLHSEELETARKDVRGSYGVALVLLIGLIGVTVIEGQKAYELKVAQTKLTLSEECGSRTFKAMLKQEQLHSFWKQRCQADERFIRKMLAENPKLAVGKR